MKIVKTIILIVLFILVPILTYIGWYKLNVVYPLNSEFPALGLLCCLSMIIAEIVIVLLLVYLNKKELDKL